MPVYEYNCQNCGKLFDQLRSIRSRNALTNCDTCGTIATRVLSRFNTLAKLSNRTQDDNKISRPTVALGGSAIRIEGGGTYQIDNNSFVGMRAGVSIAAAGGAKVRMSGNRFQNVSFPVEVTDE